MSPSHNLLHLCIGDVRLHTFHPGLLRRRCAISPHCICASTLRQTKKNIPVSYESKQSRETQTSVKCPEDTRKDKHIPITEAIGDAKETQCTNWATTLLCNKAGSPSGLSHKGSKSVCVCLRSGEDECPSLENTANLYNTPMNVKATAPATNTIIVLVRHAHQPLLHPTTMARPCMLSSLDSNSFELAASLVFLAFESEARLVQLTTRKTDPNTQRWQAPFQPCDAMHTDMRHCPSRAPDNVPLAPDGSPCPELLRRVSRTSFSVSVVLAVASTWLLRSSRGRSRFPAVFAGDTPFVHVPDDSDPPASCPYDVARSRLTKARRRDAQRSITRERPSASFMTTLRLYVRTDGHHTSDR